MWHAGRYDSDSYADDLPYWNYQYGRPHLIVPYTLDNNDMVSRIEVLFHVN